jgi:hypothetical protein
MRRARLALPLVGVLLLAGCGSESPRQADARRAVERSLSPQAYDVSRTRCTGNPAPWFVERETEVFVCAAKLRHGGCDWYAATLANAGWEVTVDRRQAGCILPF